MNLRVVFLEQGRIVFSLLPGQGEWLCTRVRMEQSQERIRVRFNPSRLPISSPAFHSHTLTWTHTFTHIDFLLFYSFGFFFFLFSVLQHSIVLVFKNYLLPALPPSSASFDEPLFFPVEEEGGEWFTRSVKKEENPFCSLSSPCIGFRTYPDTKTAAVFPMDGD